MDQSENQNQVSGETLVPSPAELESKSSSNGLELILLRNDFYRDNYRRAVLAFLLMFIVDCALSTAIIYQWMNPPASQYFAAADDGRIINIHPLSDPAVSNEFLLQWTSTAVQRTFALDYVHWREQLQSVSDFFTPDGWKWFINALQGTNNLKTLVQLQMVSGATITGAPQILEHAIIGGRYAWKISVPILITYSSTQKTFNIPATVTVVVVRMPITQAPDRIAINNFIVDTGGSAGINQR